MKSFSQHRSSLQQTVIILHVLVKRYSLERDRRRIVKESRLQVREMLERRLVTLCTPREWRQNEAVCRHRESRHVSITENVREASGVYAFRVTWLWRLIEFLSATWYAHRCPRVDTLTVARQSDANSFSRVNESFGTLSFLFLFSFLSFTTYNGILKPHAKKVETQNVSARVLWSMYSPKL